jgi:gamma-glutamyltranspeptidase / glutathione hydrolase
MFHFEDSIQTPKPRPPAYAPNAMVATSHPLAVQAGIEMLHRGGHAVDAAIAAAAVLAVVEPLSTSLAGDAFALLFQADDQSVHALNGSGRAPQRLTLDHLHHLGLQSIPETSALSVMTPGVVDAWSQCHKKFGKLPWDEILAPAIAYARDGFPITPVVGAIWKNQTPKLAQNAESARVFLPAGRAPAVGSRFRNPDLSRALQLIAEKGPDEFYRGSLAEQIVDGVARAQGVLSIEDLNAHHSDWVTPIAVNYRGYTVLEMPPNSQGIVVSLVLRLMQKLDYKHKAHNSPEYLHLMIEAVKIALAEAAARVTDPCCARVDGLLDDASIDSLFREIDTPRAQLYSRKSKREADTVYIAVVDAEGNGVSFINSLYRHFGSGITVPGTGILLQNRATGFSYSPEDPNCLAPGKRCYHTLMPAMILRDRELWSVLGAVGAYMQPQAQVQMITNMIDFHFDPQAAIDATRFRFLKGTEVSLESGFPDTARHTLISLGHHIEPGDYADGYGGGQAILVDDTGLCGGSDSRKDGFAAGY